MWHGQVCGRQVPNGKCTCHLAGACCLPACCPISALQRDLEAPAFDCVLNCCVLVLCRPRSNSWWRRTCTRTSRRPRPSRCARLFSLLSRVLRGLFACYAACFPFAGVALHLHDGFWLHRTGAAASHHPDSLCLLLPACPASQVCQHEQLSLYDHLRDLLVSFLGESALLPACLCLACFEFVSGRSLTLCAAGSCFDRVSSPSSTPLLERASQSSARSPLSADSQPKTSMRSWTTRSSCRSRRRCCTPSSSR